MITARKTNIAITSAGRRATLLRLFERELAALFPESNVFALDANPEMSSACRIARKSFKIPGAREDGYINALMEICEREQIGLIIPTIDTELLILAQNRHPFKERGVEIVISDPDLVAVCRDKRLTAQFLIERGVSAPRVLSKVNPTFPLIAKPYDGSASLNVSVVKNSDMLSQAQRTDEKLIFLEYLSPEMFEEITADLYYSRAGKLLCAVPRRRLEVRAGEVSKGLTVREGLPEFLFKHFESLDGARGCITLQLFRQRNALSFKVIELNARFGGGYPLSYYAGANYPQWIIKEYFLNEQLQLDDNWEENLLMLRYDNEVLVHGYTSPL